MLRDCGSHNNYSQELPRFNQKRLEKSSTDLIWFDFYFHFHLMYKNTKRLTKKVKWKKKWKGQNIVN